MYCGERFLFTFIPFSSLSVTLLFRFALGCADAMLWCSANAMLMNLFPDKQSLIMGSTESSQSIGYSLGIYHESPLLAFPFTIFQCQCFPLSAREME